jgi:hypothetical protein
VAERRRKPVDCYEASQLATLTYERPLSLNERLRLGIHRLFCGPCRAYKRQLQLLQAQIARLGPTPAADDTRLGDAARERIRARLREKA